MNIRISPSLVLFFAAALQPCLAQQIQVNKDNRTIAITTSADATANAEVASVEIGYLVYGPDQDAAYAQGSKVSNAITAALRAANVASDDIQSQSQNISPVTEYNNQQWTPAEKAERKFQVQQTWNVKTSAADASRVLDTAIQAGANQSGQISWNVADQDALQAKAAQSALERARRIAQQMAAGLNSTLGSLVYASNEAPPREPLFRGGGSAGGTYALAAKQVKPLSISPQKVTASATVYAVFSLQ